MGFVIDSKALREALKAQQVAVDVATKAAVDRGAALVELTIKQTLTSSSHPKGTPTPSRPDEPPSLVTGQLRRSVRAEPAKMIVPGTYGARIGPTAVYGRIQELGGMAGWGRSTRLPPRPYVQPTVNQLITSGRIAEIFKAAWNTARKV